MDNATSVTYEQFCTHKRQNVWLEEQYDANGTVTILCRQRGNCSKTDCLCIRRLMKSLEISKTFQN